MLTMFATISCTIVNYNHKIATCKSVVATCSCTIATCKGVIATACYVLLYDECNMHVVWCDVSVCTLCCPCYTSTCTCSRVIAWRASTESTCYGCISIANSTLHQWNCNIGNCNEGNANLQMTKSKIATLWMATQSGELQQHLNCNRGTPDLRSELCITWLGELVAIGWHLNIFGCNWLTFDYNSTG